MFTTSVGTHMRPYSPFRGAEGIADRRQPLRAVAQGRHRSTPRCSAPFARGKSPTCPRKRGTILQEQGGRIDSSSGSRSSPSSRRPSRSPCTTRCAGCPCRANSTNSSRCGPRSQSCADCPPQGGRWSCRWCLSLCSREYHLGLPKSKYSFHATPSICHR